MTPARAARVAAGLTLKQAAKRARVTPSYLGHCERHGLTYVLLRRLCRAYGCRIEDLLLVRGGTADYTRRR